MQKNYQGGNLIAFNKTELILSCYHYHHVYQSNQL